MLASDLMKRDVLCTRPDETVGALCDRLQAAHVHCAPVIDPEGTLIGIVSTEDLLFGGVFGLPAVSHFETEAPKQASAPTVADVMTSPAFSIGADASVAELAALMWAHRIHHLPVVDGGGRLCGIVSSLDLCRVVLRDEDQGEP